MEERKYEYYLYTWGGFYNDKYQVIHKEKSGDHYFNTEKERDGYLEKLKMIADKLDANYLMHIKHEGYNCRIKTTLHRVIRHEEKDYYTNYELFVGYEYSTAEYHLEWKWQPGFNDYPLGEEFDYDNGDYKVMSEWITGAFELEV